MPQHVQNAAREGIVLIISKCVFTGRPLRWRSRLTDHGEFLLTAEDGLRYSLPILPESGDAQMVSEDLLPYLAFMRASVDIEIERGHEVRAAFWAARLASVIHENPDMFAGWFDPTKHEGIKQVIYARDDARAKEYLREVARSAKHPVYELPDTRGTMQRVKALVSPDGEPVS